MLYDSTKSLLRNILRSLESAESTPWDDHLESSKACLFEMHQMSRGLGKAYKSDKALEAQRVARAMPHVRTMAIAIRLRDQAKAIEASRAALAEM